MICSLCAAEHTHSCQHCIGYCFEHSQRVACQSSLPTLQSAFCWLRSVPDGLQCSLILTSQPGLWWMGLHEDGSPENSHPSLSDRMVQMRGSAAAPALLWRGNKPNWTVGMHNTRSTEKSQNPRSRFLQTWRFPWSKLHLHKIWPMLSVLTPESIRSMIKLWPQNHKMFEVWRNLWRGSNLTLLLRAMSAGAAC